MKPQINCTLPAVTWQKTEQLLLPIYITTPTHTNNINMFAWTVFVLNITHAYIRRESERKHTEERKRKRTRQEKTGQVASQPLLTATLRIRNRREVRGRGGGGKGRRREEALLRNQSNPCVAVFLSLIVIGKLPSPFDSRVFLLLFHRPLIRRDPGRYELRLKLFFPKGEGGPAGNGGGGKC